MSKEIQRLIEDMGGVKKLKEEMKQFQQDIQLVSERWEELLEQYSDKWIAFLRGEVIASTDNLQELIDSIPQKDRGSAIVKFMDTDPKPLILMAV